jgi:hypothetical protein
MPTLYYHVEAPGVNILKTVTDQVVMGLLDEIDLVRYFQDAIYILTSYTAYSQYDDGHGAPTLVKNRCDVEVKYILDKSKVPWPVETPYTTTAYGIRADKKGIHTPILYDPDAGILIEHNTVACGIVMNFTLTFQVFDDCHKAFDTIKTKYSGSLVQKPFDLSYSYPVSFSLLKYLTEVYKAKTAYQNKTLLDYINDYKKTEISFDVRKSQLTQPDADKELMVQVQQLNCLAQMTMDQEEPEVKRVDQVPDSYTINFEFTLQFGRPNLIAVHTPISVDNTLLPYNLFENNIIESHYNPNVSGQYQDLLVGEFAKRTYGNFNNAHAITRLPSYDTWLVSDQYYQNYKYRPLIIAHFTLDGPITTIGISQLDDVVLHPIVVDILKQTRESIFNFGGLFNIAVYADDLRLDSNLLSLDENLNLSITSNRMDKSYHLVISETTDIQKISPEWNDILIKYRYFFPMTIERNINHLIKQKYFYIDYDNSLLTAIGMLSKTGRLKSVLKALVDNGEVTNEIYQYTQNPSQLADYMSYTKSIRDDYTVPVGTDNVSVLIQQFYSTYASVEGRSLVIAFLEECLKHNYININNLPDKYLKPNTQVFPFYNGDGGYYGFNTPLRVLSYNIRTK